MNQQHLPENLLSPSDSHPQQIVNGNMSITTALSAATCQSCRKLHRKCDKLLPSCSYCTKRGYICSYEKAKDEQSVVIRKKHPVNMDNLNNTYNTVNSNSVQYGNLSSYRSTPYPSPACSMYSQNSTTINQLNTMMNQSPFVNIAMLNQQVQMNYRLMTNQTLDIYYQYLCNGFPMVERRILERVLDYHSMSGNDNSVNNVFSSVMINQLYDSVSEYEKDQSLLYSLQAMCLQQLGHKEASNQVYLNAKQLVGKYFDEVDSQSIMIAMTFLGTYLVGEGEKKKAKSIISSVKSAIAPYKNPQTNSNSSSAMASFSLPITSQEQTKPSGGEDSISEWVITQPKCFTSFLVDTQLRALDAYFGEEDHPTTYILDGFEMIGNNNLKLTKLREMIPDCRVLSKEAVDILLSLLPAMECLANVILTNFNKMPTLKLLYSLIFKQLHLDVLKNAEESIRDIPQLLNIASQIIELTKDEMFPYQSICASKPVIMACTLRVHYFNLLGPNENVSEDLRAMKILSKNFKAIQTTCTPLMKALESIMYLQQSKSSGVESLFDFGEDVFSIESLSNSSITPMSASSKGSLTPQDVFDSYQLEYAPTFKSLGIETEMIDVFIDNMSEQERLYNTDKLKLMEKRLELVDMFRTISGKNNDVFGIVASEFLKKQVAQNTEK